MKVLVVDVAAESGGALTVFEHFRLRFEQDADNQYVCLLSKPEYRGTANVKYMNYPWVKKSYFHRLWFDNFYIKRVIKSEKPDRVLSLQNRAVSSCGLPQDVYFQNALFISDKHYSFSQSKKLWLYQNIIACSVKKSLKKASGIVVQAEWIKTKLAAAWRIDESIIRVQPVECDSVFKESTRKDEPGCNLFYPANNAMYKNHITLLKACKSIWDKRGRDCGLRLTLTGAADQLNCDCAAVISSGNYPVDFCGRLSKERMLSMYERSVLVFPSLIETVGIPLLEAAECRCDIIAADLVYAHEMLKSYDKVQFFEPENVQELEKIIESYI